MRDELVSNLKGNWTEDILQQLLSYVILFAVSVVGTKSALPLKRCQCSVPLAPPTWGKSSGLTTYGGNKLTLD